MDFWGFVILDGRRIGYDLWLYKEVGSEARFLMTRGKYVLFWERKISSRIARVIIKTCKSVYFRLSERGTV